jgi:hypothetical protein
MKVMRRWRSLVWLVVLGIVLVPALSFASMNPRDGHPHFEQGRSSPAGWRTVTTTVGPLVPRRSAPAELAATVPGGHASPGHLSAPFVPPRSR